MARGDGDREPISLEQILAEVAGQRRLRGKISLLARRWQEVRALDPRERERVAAALGSQAAWNRLEAYFGRDGTISEAELAVKETLERAAADPGRVREVVRRARSGDYRGAAAGAVEIVAGDAASEALADAVEPEGEAGTDAESEPSADPPVIAAQESGEATEEGAADETQPEAEATEPEPSREATVPEAEPERIEQEQLEREQIEREQIEREQIERQRIEQEQPGRHRQEASPPESYAWEREDVRPLATATERLAALRALRRTGAGSGGGAADRARFLARLGPGWAARRALTQMIRAEALDDLDEALSLIRRLETDVQRAWCLGDLVEHWELDERAVAAVLEAVPTRAARRRLAGRIARRA